MHLCVGADTSTALEELCWLLRMTAHLIADPGEGETPLPPLTVADAAARSSEQGQPDLLVALSCALVDNAALCLDPSAAHVISPRYILQFQFLLPATVVAGIQW